MIVYHKRTYAAFGDLIKVFDSYNLNRCMLFGPHLIHNESLD